MSKRFTWKQMYVFHNSFFIVLSLFPSMLLPHNYYYEPFQHHWRASVLTVKCCYCLFQGELCKETKLTNHLLFLVNKWFRISLKVLPCDFTGGNLFTLFAYFNHFQNTRRLGTCAVTVHGQVDLQTCKLGTSEESGKVWRDLKIYFFTLKWNYPFQI